MKKLVVIAVSIILGTATLNTQTGAQQQTGSAPAVEKTTNARLAGETIDNIQVPYEILNAIQLYFQGYAVTHAKEGMRNGVKVYQLQVDRDSEMNNADSFYLVFNDKWEFMAQEHFVMPQQPKPQAPKPESEDDKPEQEQQQEATENDNSRHNRPQQEENEDLEEEGGQGGASDNEGTGNGNDEEEAESEEKPDRPSR